MRGIAPLDVTPPLLDEAAILYLGEPARLPEAALKAALDPAQFVARRTLFGGPAPDSARAELTEHQEQLAADESYLRAAEERLTAAAARLESAIDALVG